MAMRSRNEQSSNVPLSLNQLVTLSGYLAATLRADGTHSRSKVMRRRIAQNRSCCRSDRYVCFAKGIENGRHLVTRRVSLSNAVSELVGHLVERGHCYSIGGVRHATQMWWRQNNQEN